MPERFAFVTGEEINLLVDKVFLGIVLVFSGTALSSSRFIFSPVTKANRYVILALILLKDFLKRGISLGYFPVLAGVYSVT